MGTAFKKARKGGNIMPFIEQLALETGRAGVNAGMGLLLEGHQDRRQIRQQQKLQDMQIAGNKEMTDYQYNKMLQMWKDTNYGAQAEELRKAGLNVGLMYGMGGGGGSTAGGGTSSVQGGSAPDRSQIPEVTGMGIQLGMMQAQKNLIEAQTEKTKAETEKTAGVDTTEAQTRIASLTQGIDNQKAIKTLTEIESQIKNVELQIQKGTQEEQIQTITAAMAKARSEVDILEQDVIISKATATDKIKQINASLIGTYLNNQLTKAHTAQSGATTSLITAETRNANNKISMWAAENYIDLMNMSSDQRRTKVAEELKDQKLETQGIEIITQAVDGIFRRLGERGTPTRNPVGFK